MVSSTSPEQVKIWQTPGLAGVDLLHANFVTKTFPRHSHEGFGFGIIERGALGFYYRGENVVASQGLINLVNPGEVHTGQAAVDSGWTYRMFYLDAGILQDIASQIAGHRVEIPFFKTGVLHDDLLAQMIRQLHIDLEDSRNPLLERETGFLLMLSRFIQGHSDDPPPPQPLREAASVIRQARDYIHDHLADDISVGHLATIADMSHFHFIRMFCQHTGLPPHAYLMQSRVHKARELIARGRSLADAAYETGFADQSHFTNRFKRIFGYTPGQYRNSVQDS